MGAARLPPALLSCPPPDLAPGAQKRGAIARCPVLALSQLTEGFAIIWGCFWATSGLFAACSAAALPHGADKTPPHRRLTAPRHQHASHRHQPAAALPIPWGFAGTVGKAGSDNRDPGDAGQSQSCLLGCSGFVFLLLVCCGLWGCPAPLALALQHQWRGHRVPSAPIPGQKLRLDGHSDAPGSRVQPEDSLMSYRPRRTRRQQFSNFPRWHRGVKSHLYAPWLHQRASLPWSIDIGFLIASLTLLAFFCWLCPEARSPPGALALACQN